MPDLAVLLRRVSRLVARFRRPLSALLAGVAVLAVIESVTPAPAPTRPVAVAARDLAAGVVLSAADVRVVAMAPSLVPHGASVSEAGVVGRIVAGPLRTGEAVTDRRVLGPSLLAGYPRGLVAAPIRIQDEDAAALLAVGDRVDVLAATRDSPAADRVVAGARIVALPRPSADHEEGALLVLAVTPGEATVLAQAAATAPLSITLLR